MKKRFLVLYSVIFSSPLFMPSLLLAQSNDVAEVKYLLSKDPDSLWKGDFVKLTIEVKPALNMRVYSSLPSPNQAYSPAHISFDSDSRGYDALEGLREEGALFNEYDDIVEGQLRYFKKTVKFTQQLRITEDRWKIFATFEYTAGDGESNSDYEVKIVIAPTQERPEEIPVETEIVEDKKEE